ncbi:helix-turn-helix transcriptional regulator [Actinomycetes bacterium KLBMP 9797]
MPTKRSEYVQTIRAQYLGIRMRDLRDQHGLTLKYVGGYLGVEFSTLARYERAEWPFRKEHVKALLDLYGVYDEAERGELVRLAENAWRADHWYRDDAKPNAAWGPMPPAWWIHDQAEEICVYSPTIMPTMIQNVAYLDEVLGRTHLGTPLPEEQRKKRAYEIRQRIDALRARGEKTPKLRMVVDEGVLRRPVAGIAALKAQLEYVVDMVRKLPNVDIHVIRNGAPAHGGIYGGFTVYRMPQGYPPVAMVEYFGGTLLIEAEAAEKYDKLFNHLAADIADSDADSLALINTIKEEL